MVHLMAFSYRDRRLLQATLDDITERKRTEEALRESRQLLETVLENSAASIYAKRKDGRYTYINREMEILCNVVREQVLGSTDFEVFPKEIAEQWRTNDLTAMTHGQADRVRGDDSRAAGGAARPVKEDAANLKPW